MYKMLPQVLLIFPLISLELYFKIYVCCCLYVCHPNCCKTLHPVQSSHTSVKPKQVICFYVMFFITGSQIFFLLYFQICSFYPVKEISLFLSCVSSHICTFILRLANSLISCIRCDRILANNFALLGNIWYIYK